MDEDISMLEQTDPPKERDETDEGNNYEFYVLLQRLKSGGMSFDTFLEQALEWATH